MGRHEYGPKSLTHWTNKKKAHSAKRGRESGSARRGRGKFAATLIQRIQKKGRMGITEKSSIEMTRNRSRQPK